MWSSSWLPWRRWKTKVVPVHEIAATWLTSQTCVQSIIGSIFGQTAHIFRKYTIGELTWSQQCFVTPFLCIPPNYSSYGKWFHALFVWNSIPECFVRSGQHLLLDCVWSPIVLYRGTLLTATLLLRPIFFPGKMTVYLYRRKPCYCDHLINTANGQNLKIPTFIIL